MTSPDPVEFSVDFFENDLRIQYSISLDLGLFLDEEYERHILSETLSVNGDMVFNRKDTLVFGNLNVIRKYLMDVPEDNREKAGEIAKYSITRDELFLTNGFKLIYAPRFTKLVVDWFSNKFMVICRADSNAVGYVVKEDEPEAKLFSIFKDVKGKKSAAIAAEIFESYGTIRFINMFPLVIRAIQTGGTLVVDEFDASIHPMALMSIINVFHNDDINIYHAQLIFNTHNPIFLNSNLFRRDEIKFVERDDDSHYSSLYALSDFGTTGEKGVEQWKVLYEAATRIKELKPWEKFWDMDLIGICSGDEEDTVFYSILGRGGDCYGIAVYEGYE